MKYLKINYLSLLLMIFLIFSCGQGGDINPVGVTGGGDEGYGSRTDISSTKINDGNTNDSIVGTWKHDYGGGDYEILNFNADGTFYIEVYEDYQLDDSFSGTYTISGNLLILDGTITIPFSISGNTLTLYFEDVAVDYYRVS